MQIAAQTGLDTLLLTIGLHELGDLLTPFITSKLEFFCKSNRDIIMIKRN